MPAPESLSTERLTLRRPRPADAEVIFRRYASDPRVTRFMAWPTHRSLADTEGFLAFSDAGWERWGAAAYLIIRSEDSLLLGGTGLDFESPVRAETGYVLAHDAWGRGYATEALLAMVALGESLGVQELTAGCHPENARSVHVLEKGGFHLVERRARTSGFPNLEPAMTQDVLAFTRTLRRPDHG